MNLAVFSGRIAETLQVIPGKNRRIFRGVSKVSRDVYGRFRDIPGALCGFQEDLKGFRSMSGDFTRLQKNFIED